MSVHDKIPGATGFRLLRWAIDPVEIPRARRYGAAFGILGAIARPYYEPVGGALAWGILSVRGDRDEVMAIEPSPTFNQVLVGIVRNVQDAHFAEVTDSNVSETRRGAIRAVQSFISAGLDGAGWNLLNCSTDSVGTEHLANVVLGSIALLEAGKSLPEWELINLHRVFETAPCADHYAKVA